MLEADFYGEVLPSPTDLAVTFASMSPFGAFGEVLRDPPNTHERRFFEVALYAYLGEDAGGRPRGSPLRDGARR
jgi:hypothetical protein